MSRPHHGQNENLSDTIQRQYRHSVLVMRWVSRHSSRRPQLGQKAQNGSSSARHVGQRTSGLGTSRRRRGLLARGRPSWPRPLPDPLGEVLLLLSPPLGGHARPLLGGGRRVWVQLHTVPL